jgi:biopolymer transport protein ExbB
MLITGGAVLATAVMPALAQQAEAPKVRSATSFFQMFMWCDDFIGLLQIWALILLSAVGVALAIKFSIDNRRANVLPDETQLQLETMLSEKRYREAIEYANDDGSYLGKVISSGLNEAANGYNAMERAIQETGDAEVTKMLRPLEYLNIIGSLGPMLGLFGTVYGMIVAFNQLVASGGKPDPAALAGGVSAALVTTFWGLIVAMPALASYSLIRNKIDELTTEGLNTAARLINPFKPTPKKATASAPVTARPRATPKPPEDQ